MKFLENVLNRATAGLITEKNSVLHHADTAANLQKYFADILDNFLGVPDEPETDSDKDIVE